MFTPEIYAANVIILDDEFANVLLLKRVLEQNGFSQIRCLTDPRQFEDAMESAEPDIVLLDLNMPYINGFTIMETMAKRNETHSFIPILVLTADNTTSARQEALTAGANDFLTKPFDLLEVVLRVKNLVRMRLLHCELQKYNHILEWKVTERTRELADAQVELLERLGLAIEYRDDDTGAHIRRVGDLAAGLAQLLGCSEEFVQMIRLAAPLHDIGKIGIVDEILLKPGKLTQEEFCAMQRHAEIGARILTGSRSRLLQLAEQIAVTHHEKWDGSGYPTGLAGEGIPLSGRIVAVVDVFDALTHSRPYKEPWPVAEALAEIQRLNGTQFDPRVVEAFMQVISLEEEQDEYKLAA